MVSWLRGNMGIFRDYPQDERYATPEEYLTAMSDCGTWGDYHTLLGVSQLIYFDFDFTKSQVILMQLLPIIIKSTLKYSAQIERHTPCALCR